MKQLWQRRAHLHNTDWRAWRALGERAWLEDRFTIGDLIMIDVLRTAPEDELVAAHPNLSAYVERGMARPAFKTAMAVQMAAFARNEPVTA